MSDVAASLRYAFRAGVAQKRPELYRDALKFAKQVTDFFKQTTLIITQRSSAQEESKTSLVL